jgi:Holliday junction DNA helicase RuvB
MNPEDSLLSPITTGEEESLERSLRPDSFSDYVGQSAVKESLRIAIQSARQRKATVDHVLLYGPPGLGKTSLAHLIAKEMGSNLRVTSGPIISKAGDLAAILTNLQEGDILFIDEIHRMQRTVEEVLYPAMEDGCLDIMLGKGPSARSLRLDLPRFTLVGATTRAGALSQPLRERFGLLHRLDYYEEEELAAILDRSSQLLNIDISQPALLYLASRARKTPRVANRLLRRIRDFALVKGHHKIGVDEVALALNQLQIDQLGLDKTDVQLLTIMRDQFGGGPVGLETLAAATGEEATTIEDVIEPYLLRLGLLDRTPRGRMLTDQAKIHLGA